MTFKHGRGGYARKCRCRECLDAALAYNREWNARNKERRAATVWRSNIKRWYGITGEMYGTMVEERNGRCDICHRQPDSKLHIDHDHETGRVRGLLCNQCNRAIGLMGDDPDRLIAAAQYLHVEWN